MDYYNYDTLCYPMRPSLLLEGPQHSFYQYNSSLTDHGPSRIKQEELGGFQSYPYHQQRNYDALNLPQQHVHPYSAIMLPPYTGVSISQPLLHTLEGWDDGRSSSVSSLVEGSELEMVDMDQMSTLTGVSGVVEDLVGNGDAYKRDEWEEVLQQPSGNNEWRFPYEEWEEVLQGPSGSKRRRSQSAPIPVTPSFPVPIPVPNLTKKSRGRRVPTISSLEDIRSAASGAGRKRQSTGGKTARMYMCEVKGCGKCFARGEHLKRHVRSIHTYEKREVSYPCIEAHIFTLLFAHIAHKCPYPGCYKDFSRHDNLVQHLRVHKDYVPFRSPSSSSTSSLLLSAS